MPTTFQSATAVPAGCAHAQHPAHLQSSERLGTAGHHKAVQKNGAIRLIDLVAPFLVGLQFRTSWSIAEAVGPKRVEPFDRQARPMRHVGFLMGRLTGGGFGGQGHAVGTVME